MTRVPSPASPHKDISAKTIFKAASQEIDQLQSLIESLQSVTPFHSQAETAIDGAEITAIQSLDYIAQSLFVLSNVLDEAGNHASQASQAFGHAGNAFKCQKFRGEISIFHAYI